MLFRGKRGLIHWSILLITAILLSGCTGLPFGKDKQPQTLGTFVGGTEGLEAAFATDEPPDAILDNGQEEFFITLLLQNKGEYTIPTGGVVASLSGIVQSSWNLATLNVKNTFDIFGTSKQGELVIPGAQEELTFGTARFTPDLPGDTSFNLGVDVCYSYKTQTVSKICLQKDVLQRERKSAVCSITNQALGEETSGGPIHATSFRQSSVGKNKVNVYFKISNKGIGAVYEPGTFTTSCTGKDTEEHRVRVKVFSPENTFTIKCTQLGNTNTGVVKLVQNSKDITCSIETAGLQEVTFQDLLVVEMTYMYREAIKTSIRVVDGGSSV